MGKRCGKCSKVVKISNEEFRKECKKIYGENIDFSTSIYDGSSNKSGAICKKHGYFERRAYDLLRGKGCPLCRHGNSLSEERFYIYLKSKISCQIERRKKFPWLNGKHLDFYLPEYKIAIEYQGVGHFTFVPMPGNSFEKHERQKKNGMRKNMMVVKNTMLNCFISVMRENDISR